MLICHLPFPIEDEALGCWPFYLSLNTYVPNNNNNNVSFRFQNLAFLLGVVLGVVDSTPVDSLFSDKLLGHPEGEKKTEKSGYLSSSLRTRERKAGKPSHVVSRMS
jgi:hypothetical protein